MARKFERIAERVRIRGVEIRRRRPGPARLCGPWSTCRSRRRRTSTARGDDRPGGRNGDAERVVREPVGVAVEEGTPVACVRTRRRGVVPSPLQLCSSRRCVVDDQGVQVLYRAGRPRRRRPTTWIGAAAAAPRKITLVPTAMSSASNPRTARRRRSVLAETRARAPRRRIFVAEPLIR